MSFLSGGKSKDKDPFAKKSQFYVEFLGWMECRGLRGDRYTEPVVQELRRRHQKGDALPKLTIQVSRKDLRITQEVEEKKKRGIKKIKFPTIPARDVTFVHQSHRPADGRPDDIVACIYLGYMPRTQTNVHVHVYRFDEPSTASLFVNQMAHVVEDNQVHIREVETDLIRRGEINDPEMMHIKELSINPSTDSAVGSASSVYSDDESPAVDSDEIEPDLQSLIDFQPFDSVTHELKHRLQMGDVPLLLPPKDYDTISRAHGNLEEINKRRCLNQNIIGLNALAHDESGSQENEPDVATSGSDAAQPEESISVDKPFVATLKLADNLNSPSVSPQSTHVAFPFKDKQKSPLVTQKPNVFYESTNSPRALRRIDAPDSIIPITGVHSGNTLSEMQPTGSVYPYKPKASNSPISPKMLPLPQKIALSRQSSQNSHNSESSKLSNRSDDARATTPIQHYKYGSNDDIYAMPFKPPNSVPPMDEIPPDYQDDDDLEQPQNNLAYGQSFLGRSLPGNLIRERLNASPSSMPNSSEWRTGRQPDSPVLVKGPPQLYGNGGIYSPQLQRNVSSKR